MDDEQPIVVKKRETVPGLIRNTFWPQMSYGHLDCDIASGNTAVCSLEQLLRFSNKNSDENFISMAELDSLEGRTFWDNPIIVYGIFFSSALMAIAAIIWALL